MSAASANARSGVPSPISPTCQRLNRTSCFRGRSHGRVWVGQPASFGTRRGGKRDHWNATGATALPLSLGVLVHARAPYRWVVVRGRSIGRRPGWSAKFRCGEVTVLGAAQNGTGQRRPSSSAEAGRRVHWPSRRPPCSMATASGLETPCTPQPAASVGPQASRYGAAWGARLRCQRDAAGPDGLHTKHLPPRSPRASANPAQDQPVADLAAGTRTGPKARRQMPKGGRQGTRRSEAAADCLLVDVSRETPQWEVVSEGL